MVEQYIPKVELYYQNPIRYEDLPIVHDAEGAYKVLKEHWSKQIGYLEEFNALFLDNKFRVLAFSTIAKGGYNAVHVDLRVAFTTALTLRASSIILAHNHPSGYLKPSPQDVRLTNEFTKAGKVLNITINDHLILTPHDSYYSFNENSDFPDNFELIV